MQVTPAAVPVAVTHVTVVDVARGRRVPDQTVLVRGDTVVRVGPAARVRPPASPTVARVGSLADAPALVARLADAGAHHVRLVPGVREDGVPAVVSAARDRGRTVVWRREADGAWRVAHLHASRLVPP